MSKKRLSKSEWEALVGARLQPAALRVYAAGDVTHTLDVWYRAGYKAGFAARRLNRRYAEKEETARD